MTPGCSPRLELRALPGLPIVEPGADLVDIISAGLERAELTLEPGDVLVVASKVVSRAENELVDMATVTPSARALEVAAECEKDPRLVEVILADSAAISRCAPGVLIVRHRLGFVSANAAIDRSNTAPPDANPDTGPWLLRLPRDPDASAARIRDGLGARLGTRPAVIISDSLGRPFRLGAMGAAIGMAGMPGLVDQRGRADLFGRELEHTDSAYADAVAAAADLVAGQSSEGRAVVHVRGLSFQGGDGGAGALNRDPDKDLYA
jgi:coenzyme F420-0:L-glutamate ligase/coenzyme F420-1:gamma-L-glutamate ligase